jgi:hypothetical protein
MSSFQPAVFIGVAAVDYIDELVGVTPQWVREDNIGVYDLITPNRTIGGNYVEHENKLATGPRKRHTLGLVGGNEISKLAGNPQDIESELRGLTRPLTGCPSRQYQATEEGQEKIIINNRKTNMAIDIRPMHLAEAQMWAYPVTYAPQPLRKETCGRPEKY